MSGKKARILLVDDDSSTRSMFRDFLTRRGFEVVEAATLQEMDEKIDKRQFEVLLLDMILPDGNSLERIPSLRSRNPSTTIVVITGAGDVPAAVEAMGNGADNFLVKPVGLADLEAYLRKALEMESLRREHIIRRRQTRAREPFFGTSTPWVTLKESAKLAADSDSVILLLGETGTGKGVLARWIHDNSRRCDHPFVELNCSTLRGELLASELFGHVRGAFTSAVADKQGLIEVADGGTLFLDEIGEMDVGTQAQLLNVVEEKRFRRVGDVRERLSEFRLICASNSDLSELCRQKRFREDLYFRINVFPVHVPPLRDMSADIPALAEYLLEELGAHKARIAPDAMRILVLYQWPGNIRELRNVLERALILSNGDDIEARHLKWLGQGDGRSSFDDGEFNLHRMQDQRIRAALSKYQGDTRKAAAALGISRATLYRRLARMKEKS